MIDERLPESLTERRGHRVSGKGPLLTVILPVFNEAEVLPLLIDRLRLAARRWGVVYELLFVDDGSTDQSFELLRTAQAADEKIRVVSLARNFGHQAAVSAGLRFARGSAVAVLDADLQDPPELLGEFLSRWQQGYDVVFGIRKKRQEGLLKRLGFAAFYRLLRLATDFEVPLDSGDFCLMDRRVVNEITAMPERAPFIRGLRAWVGFSQVGVAYERPGRAAGVSKYTLAQRFDLALDALLGFSAWPLRWFLPVGLGCAGGALMLMACLALAGGLGLSDFGFTSSWFSNPGMLFAVVLFFGGVQVFSMGMVGEYLGRILAESKSRPLFVVREVLGADDGRAQAIVSDKRLDDTGGVQ